MDMRTLVYLSAILAAGCSEVVSVDRSRIPGPPMDASVINDRPVFMPPSGDNVAAEDAGPEEDAGLDAATDATAADEIAEDTAPRDSGID